MAQRKPAFNTAQGIATLAHAASGRTFLGIGIGNSARWSIAIIGPAEEVTAEQLKMKEAGVDQHGYDVTGDLTISAYGPDDPAVTDVGPVCPAVIYPFKVRTFKPNRKALNRQVPGVRTRLTTGFDMDVMIRPSYRYKVKGKVRTANLKQRSVRINGSRRFLFGIPSGMAKRLRKATGQVSRNKVTFRAEATLRIHGAGPECEQNANSSLRTRISGVSIATALRTRWLAD